MLEMAAHELRPGAQLGCHPGDTFLVQVDDNFKVFFTITQISEKLKLFLRL